MKILILGGTGMLGHRIWLELSKQNEVAATVRNGKALNNLPYFEINDIQDYRRLEEIVADFRPQLIINCIGLIKQSIAHADTSLNIELNALLPHKVAQICDRYYCRLILFSTDCVFSGNKGNYKDDDVSDANDIYGRTKKLGEIENSENILTLRTSIVGRELRGKASLVEWFLAQENKTVQGYTKAIFSGFPTKTIAEILDKYVIPNRALHGIYNLSSDAISKFDLINLIKDEIGLKVDIVPHTDFIIDRSLDSSKFKKATHFSPKVWKELVRDIFVNDIKY